VDELALMPESVDEERAMRLAMKSPQEQPPPLPPQLAPSCYASAVMPLDLSEEEVMRLAMENSTDVPPPWSLWPMPPPSYGAQPPMQYPLPFWVPHEQRPPPPPAPTPRPVPQQHALGTSDLHRPPRRGQQVGSHTGRSYGYFLVSPIYFRYYVNMIYYFKQNVGKKMHRSAGSTQTKRIYQPTRPF
jgi:hypothetical protein